MDKPVKILQIVGSMHPGGIENFLMNLYEHAIDTGTISLRFCCA